MPAYRCYFIDKNGRIGSAEWLENEPSIETAVASGRALLEQRPRFQSIEVWDRSIMLYPVSQPAEAPEPETAIG